MENVKAKSLVFCCNIPDKVMVSPGYRYNVYVWLLDVDNIYNALYHETVNHPVGKSHFTSQKSFTE